MNLAIVFKSLHEHDWKLEWSKHVTKSTPKIVQHAKHSFEMLWQYSNHCITLKDYVKWMWSKQQRNWMMYAWDVYNVRLIPADTMGEMHLLSHFRTRSIGKQTSHPSNPTTAERGQRVYSNTILTNLYPSHLKTTTCSNSSTRCHCLNGLILTFIFKSQGLRGH